ncbi:hypothetical protein G6L37_34845 [Agrobacterium rubi]|nr:hypothetical protein [Agrobacterium rubi]NTF23747.1 hypothetical protein [Agrobacterium rubi]
MTVERFRRSVEFDAFQAIRALAQGSTENMPRYSVGEIAALHFEKFEYICSDVHYSILDENAELLAVSMIDDARRYASGEKYYMHADDYEREIRDRLAEFRDGLRPNTPDR